MAVNEAEKLLGWLNDDFQNINITHAVPTELPIVEVRQGFLDFAWELDDRTFFHIEFQSGKEPDLYRFFAIRRTLVESISAIRANGGIIHGWG